MQSETTVSEIEYPESDGNPIAETELHLDWTFRVREILRWRYRGQRVYVGCTLLVYFERGNPLRRVAPDVFLTFDCDPGRRRTYKTWEEGKAPDVVFEITSLSTQNEDEGSKPQIYAELGVGEYFLYDPTADYLDPPLQGYRLDQGEYHRLTPDEVGTFVSRLLNATLRLEEGELAMYDAVTGEALMTEAEAKEKERREAELARQQADARLAAEKAAREAAEAKIAQLQAELERLRGPSS
jgi:Uma2 family endonuclease